ncbi:hypothetical protein BCR42DRAFT_404426, partial [Absidia repens]
MDNIFTFFNDGVFSHVAHVYPGKVKNEHSTSVIFTISISPSEFLLYDSRSKLLRHQVLLRGVFGGLNRSSGRIYGFNVIHKLGLSGLLSRNYCFIDGFTGMKFRWKISWWGNGWKLMDPSNNKIASFRRKSFKMSMQGRLTIHQQGLPEHLVHLILLTNQLVHDRLKVKELEISHKTT